MKPNPLKPDPKPVSVKKKPKPLKRTAMKKKPRKVTGEAAMFNAIWQTRPNVSFVSRTILGNEAKAQFFSHVLPKSTYPAFRLNMDNIVLLTAEEHYLWDNGSRDKLRQNPRWDKMFELEQKLKDRYNQNHRNK